ncbi:hypothetical protein FB451DRAFT_1561250 [Mycena latifolia]|nr:hypothetical protein FB451DRAFT_1561250 [Mycena latifolia]
MGNGHALLALVSNLALAALLPALVSAQSHLYDRCGGIGWGGPKTCVAGSSCVFQNPYYSQCLPVAPGGLPSPSPPPPPPPPPTSTTTSSSSTPAASSPPTSSELEAPLSTTATSSDQAPLPTSSTEDGTTSSNPATAPSSRVKPADSNTSPASSSPGSSSAPAPSGPPAPSNAELGAGNTALGGSPLSSSEVSPSASASAPASVLAASKSPTKTTAIVAGVLVPLLFLLLGGAGFVLYKRRQRARDRLAWERTHAAIADAVRQVGSGPASTAASTWGAQGYAAAGSGDTVTEPLVDAPVAHRQPAEYAPPYADESASESEVSLATRSSMDRSSNHMHASRPSV